MSADASIAGVFLSVYQHSGDSEWRQAERDVEDSRLGEVTQTRYTYEYRFGFNGRTMELKSAPTSHSRSPTLCRFKYSHLASRVGQGEPW
jgi:hypothetical protein